MIVVGTLPEQVPVNGMLGTAAYLDLENLGMVKRSAGLYTGPVTVPAINENPLAGLRNLFINGDFGIWQRGTSFTNPNNVLGADRWIISVGSGAGTVSRQTFTAGQTAVPGDPRFFARISASNAVGQNLFNQNVENVYLLESRTVTLSFWIKGASTFTLDPSYPQIRQSFGTGGSPQVLINNTGPTITVTTSWQEVVRTYTLPSVSGKTIGPGHSTACIIARRDGLQVEYDIAQAQLEFGSVATDFESRPESLEWLLCQRYYYVLAGGINRLLGVGHNISTVSGVYHVVFPVPMRTIPSTLTVTGAAADFAVQHANTGTVCSAVPTLSQGSRFATRIVATVASGLTTGQASALWIAANAPSLAFTAEL